MSSSKKIFLGILSLLPIIFMGLYFVSFFRIFAEMAHNMPSPEHPDVMPEMFFKNMIGTIILLMIAGLSTLGLLIYYIIHVVNNIVIDSNEKIIWILIFIFISMVGFPVYWYLRIWNQPNKTADPV